MKTTKTQPRKTQPWTVYAATTMQSTGNPVLVTKKYRCQTAAQAKDQLISWCTRRGMNADKTQMAAVKR